MAGSRTEEYIELYKRLETDIREIYGLRNEASAVSWFRNQVGYAKKYSRELRYCSDVRNLLQHGERFEDYQLDDGYLVVPSEKMVATLRSVVEWVERIPRASEMGVATGQLCRAGMGDRILPIMRTMIEKSYTYVPILVDGRVAGVFSANTLLARVIDEGIGFDEDDTFAEIEDLLSLDAYDSEAFEFVSVDTSATEIIDLFETLPNGSKRLGAVFVTNNGDRNQRLLGMITAWDVASM